ncbi:uncharacterized protein TNCV_460551 [Trichonephila clavipes]|nr:uncharacterized protein TNCV_460551 [Trichonephila clavipes]
MVSWEYLWSTFRCRRVAGVSPLLSIGWWYLSSVSPKRHCCRVSIADKGCRVYPLDPHPDATVLYSGCTPDFPLTVTPHRSLNSCRGVISETDILCSSETEILEGLSDQGVTQAEELEPDPEDKFAVMKCFVDNPSEYMRALTPIRFRKVEANFYTIDKFRSSATKLVSLSFKYINNSPKPPRGKELSKDLKDAIIKLNKESKSQRQIAKIIGKSPATVQKIIEKFQAEGNTLNKPRTGRLPIFPERERRIIVRNVIKNPKISAPKWTTDVKNNFAELCNPETIHRVLRKAGYHGRNMRRKPFVSKVNRKKRIDFAKENEKQDRNVWNSVIFFG